MGLPPIYIVLGAAIAAFLTGLFNLTSLIVSKENKVSDFRQKWLDSLRQETSKLLAAIETLIRLVEHKVEGSREGLPLAQRAEFRATYERQYRALNEMRFRVLLRLNPKEHQELETNLRQIVEKFYGSCSMADLEEIGKLRETIVAETQQTIKDTWEKVKKGENMFRYLRIMIIVVLVGAAIGGPTVYLILRSRADHANRTPGKQTSQINDSAPAQTIRAKEGGPGPPANGVLKLDPSLEAALRQHLQNQNPPAPAGIPRWGISVLIVLALGVLIGVIWWSLNRKPEATPLTVAIATLTAVSVVIEKLVGNGQVPPFGNVPWLVAIVALTLVIVGIALLFEGWRGLSGLHRSPDPDFVKRGSLLGAALLVFGFSAALLALVPPLLFQGKAVPTKPCPQCPTQGAMEAQKIGVFSLNGIGGLGDGRKPEDKNIGGEKIQQLTGDLGKNNAQAGDILLLLGSADCIATKPINKGGLWHNNEDLANARANWVKDGLQGQAAVKGIKIETLPLPQHGRCGPTRNVRAVYPFLIHGEGN